MDSIAADRLAKEVIGHTIGGWTPDSVINFGKSAVVLHASRDVGEAAVKIFDRELIERFGRAAQLERINRELTLRGHSHPNLIAIYDGGFDDKLKVAFVIMEYLPFPNLATLLPKFPQERIWPIIAQVASAACFLESRQLCHRDIKPDNIAVSPDFQKAVLLDLGVLKPQSATTDGGGKALTDLKELNFIGTLQYSSPEYLFRHEKDDEEGWRALSFYQLGAVLHDLITGKRIFAEASELFSRLVDAVKNDPLAIEAATVSPQLVQLAKSCLVKDPALRLKLVSWDSFNERTDADATADLRLAIRRRVETDKEAQALSGGSLTAYERRSVILAVQSVQTKLGDLLRHERADNEVFPPMECDEAFGAEPTKASLKVTFPASREHLLPLPMSIWFSTTLVDKGSLVVEIVVAAALFSNSEEISTGAVASHNTKFFAGVFEEAIVAALLKRMLLGLVNEAQGLGKTATPRWLADFGLEKS